MEKYFKTLQALIIVALIIVILLMRSCSGNQTITEPRVITNTVTQYDTITKKVPNYVPKYITKIEYIRDTILDKRPVDTLAILKDYFATYVYVDNQKLDSLNITIKDSVSQNKIFARSITYDLIYPTTTITKEIYLNNRELYWGFGLQGRPDQFNYIGGEFLYKNKKKQIYGLGIGVNQDLQPVLSGRLYWKIGK